MTDQIIHSATVPARRQVPSDRPEALDVEWCAERAGEGIFGRDEALEKIKEIRRIAYRRGEA